MLARKERPIRAQVEMTIKTGRSLAGSFVTLKHTSIVPQSVSKATVVVSSKIQKTAVGRNRLKRRLRAILKPLLPRIKSKSVVVFARKEAVLATCVQLRTDLETLFSKIG